MKPKGPIQLRSHDPQYDFIWYKLYPFFIFRNEIIFQIQTSSCLGKDITLSTCSRRRKWYRRSSTWKSRRSTEWFTRWFEGLTGLWAAQGKNSIVDRSALVHFYLRTKLGRVNRIRSDCRSLVWSKILNFLKDIVHPTQASSSLLLIPTLLTYVFLL